MGKIIDWIKEVFSTKNPYENQPDEKMDWWDYLTIGLVFPPFIFIFFDLWIFSGIAVIIFFGSIFLNNYMEKKKEELEKNLKRADAMRYY